MEFLLLGLATAANFILLKWKYDHDRHTDLLLDLTTLAILSYLFGGTSSGMAVAMIGGAFISIYLLFTTPEPVHG